MGNLGFFRSIILPPPLPSLLSIFLVMGFYSISDALCLLLFRERSTLLLSASVFVTTIALFASCLHVVAVLAGVQILPLRVIARCIVVLGLGGTVVGIRHLVQSVPGKWHAVLGASFTDKAIWIIC